METSLTFLVAAIFILIILSAFFSGSETTLTSASKARMRTLAKAGKKEAIIFESLFKNKERLICTILLANNLVNILASSIATKILLEIFDADGIAYTTLIMTFMILVFGELIPKTVALYKADALALKISKIFNILVYIFYPITSSLNFLVNIILRSFTKIDFNDHTEIEKENDEELRGAIDLHGDNKNQTNEKEMLKSILDLEEVTVGSIMIPRKDTFSLNVDIRSNELIRKLKDSPHSRIPIWDKNPENMIGVFHIRGLIESEFTTDSDFDVRSFCQKPWFIPESTSLASQLMEFKRRKKHFAIVVDEYGEFIGIVTLEDILEEIVGDIDDEVDVKKLSKISGVTKESEGVYLVKGTVTLRDLNRELGCNLPDNNIATIAGLILYESRTIPKIGQIFSFYNFKFEIIDKRYNQIMLLKMTKEEKS